MATHSVYACSWEAFKSASRDFQPLKKLQTSSSTSSSVRVASF